MDYGELVIDLSIEVSEDDLQSYSEDIIDDMSIDEVMVLEHKIRKFISDLKYDFQFLRMDVSRF